MKFAKLIAFALIFTGLYPSSAQANIRPTVESFNVTPNEVELTAVSTRIDFELVVTHPSGIENIRTEVTIKNSRNDSISAMLVRTDSPLDLKLSRVIFRGSIDVPRQLVTGIYTYAAAPVKNNASAGYQYDTGTISGTKIRDLAGAESGILVRYLGELNLDYNTFVGPTHDSLLSFTYNDPIKYNSLKSPIWRVGETYVMSDYFEVRVPGIELTLTSSTPTVCPVDGKTLKLIAQGNCSFTVSAPKTKDYRARSYSGNATISSARIKPTLFIQQIPNQTATDLPKSIEVPAVYASSAGYIVPISETPNVCVGSVFFVKLLSGGTCTLLYQAPETSNYQATDVYRQSFEVVRSAQTIQFAIAPTIDIKVKTLTLSATSSSGNPVTYSASPSTNCKIDGNTLTLLRPGVCSVSAQQVGTATIAPTNLTQEVTITGKAPREKKTIICEKGTKKLSITKSKPKCPRGYSRAR